MSRAVRIGNALGFWGDRLDAGAEMLAREPDLDFLTLDFLAEVSMSILARGQKGTGPICRDQPEAGARPEGASHKLDLSPSSSGWPRDVIEIVRSIAPYWRSGGRCRVVTNAGGLNPMGCARACLETLRDADCPGRTVAAVSGDDVLALIQADAGDGEAFRNLDTGQPIAEARGRLVTANAYLGAQPIVEALARGADLVITGRVADPSLTVAPCVHAFGWSWDDWDRLAGATIAGHLIECGTQVTGGIASDWLQTPDVDRLGFPIVEVSPDGSCVVTKPRDTGGRVCQETVKEQLVYEIADPDAYLSPDVTVSFLSLRVEDEGDDRVRVSGARGRPAPATYKVSATCEDGYRAEGQLTVYGADAVAKARRAAEAVLERLRRDGVSLRESVVQCLGAGACRPQGPDAALAERLTETVLRIAVADDSREAVGRFARELMPLVTAGPQGTTGYAEGRPRVRPLFRFWPCLVEREQVKPVVEVVEDSVGETERRGGDEAAGKVRVESPNRSNSVLPLSPSPLLPSSSLFPSPVPRLADIAHARSGDKGIHANIGVIARRPGDFARLCREVTAERVASYFGMADASQITRYELPNLGAINLVLHGLLASPLRVDAQGKALGQVLLEMPLEVGALNRSPLPLPANPSSTPDASSLIVERGGEATAVLTLNRPERRNALTIGLMQALCETLESLAAGQSPRVVILRGAGPVFCSGLDLVETAAAELATGETPVPLVAAEWVARMLRTVATSPLVMIAAAHGGAYAGGAGLMACCDFVVAADDLRIGLPEVRRGLVPALVATVLQARLRHADLRELVLLGEPVDAKRALAMGLVHRVVAGDQVLAEARRIAAAVLKGAPEAVRQTKRLLNELRGADDLQQLSRALEVHMQARLSGEAREGLAAFRERREPTWRVE